MRGKIPLCLFMLPLVSLTASCSAWFALAQILVSYLSSVARACSYDLWLNVVWFELVRQRFSITQFRMEVNSVMLGFLIVGLLRVFLKTEIVRLLQKNVLICLV